MISVNIYQPNKHNFDIHIPSEWDDLHEHQLHFIAKTLLEQTEENTNEVRPKILKYILEGVLPAELHPVLFTIQDQLLELLPIFDFIFNTTGRTTVPSAITFGFRTYHPVSFENITCGEYEDCEIVLGDFEANPGADQLARLAAILFRPHGVPYMKFRAADNSYSVYQSAEKEKLFKKLPPEHLYSILIWYAGCRAQLPKYFNELYRGDKNNSKPDPMVFTNTIHAGAGPKNGTRDQIRCMKLYEFLYDCNQEAIKARELKEEYDKIK